MIFGINELKYTDRGSNKPLGLNGWGSKSEEYRMLSINKKKKNLKVTETEKSKALIDSCLLNGFDIVFL